MNEIEKFTDTTLEESLERSVRYGTFTPATCNPNYSCRMRVGQNSPNCYSEDLNPKNFRKFTSRVDSFPDFKPYFDRSEGFFGGMGHWNRFHIIATCKNKGIISINGKPITLLGAKGRLSVHVERVIDDKTAYGELLTTDLQLKPIYINKTTEDNFFLLPILPSNNVSGLYRIKMRRKKS